MLFRHFKSLLWEICTDKSLAVKYAIRPSQENTLYRATIKKFIKENPEAASFNVSFKKTTTKKQNHKSFLGVVQTLANLFLSERGGSDIERLWILNDNSYLYLTLTALGPSLLAIERTVNDPSRLLNDFGVPSLNRVPFANPNLSTDPGN